MPDSAKKGTDTREVLVLMPLALLAALISSFWAWKLASGQFAPVPLVSDPGAIVVGTFGHSADHNPIETSLAYSALPGIPFIDYEGLTFSQRGDAGSKSPEEIAVFLCGSAAKQLGFRVLTGLGQSSTRVVQSHAIEWRKVSKYSIAFPVGSAIFPENCIFTLIPMQFDPKVGGSAILMYGYSGLSSDKTSGDNISYAWPGISSLVASENIGNSTINPFARGSTYTVEFVGLPSDISNAVTDPSLTPIRDGMKIEGSFVPGISELNQPAEFRLSGTLSDTAANGQKNLFIAGALVGVAGGGAIWFLQLLAKLLLSLGSSPGPETAEAEIPGTAKGEEDCSEAGQRNKANESATGLGWPG